MFETTDLGPLLIAHDLPLGRIRELRGSGSEVWPGAWDASHVVICEQPGVKS